MTLWQIDVYPGIGRPDPAAEAVLAEAVDLGLSDQLRAATARGFLIEGDIDREFVEKLARQLLGDPIVERTVAARCGDPELNSPPAGCSQLVHVLLKPGVTDPVAETTARAIKDLGAEVRVRTFKKYWFSDLDSESLLMLGRKTLANDSIEQLVLGPLQIERLQLGSSYQFKPLIQPLLALDDEGLQLLSRQDQLYLTLVEMRTIQEHFRSLGREPTDAELETIAQTWSEHCSHKTLAGRIAYEDERGPRQFQNMLKETIFAVTQEIRRELGQDDWCVSVFEDNAGIVRFDDQYNVVFKVETHNHPSAIEPYGGANTGVGGVIRDPLGTGLGAKPICNTDVFCFAPPDTPHSELPPGVLHPRRVMRGVVSGVRDYGNRMGIPTINGAVYFDQRYLGNPLVYCGNVGLIPRDKSRKQVHAGDWVVAIGGRTGRDGIHGATFSSAELTSQSEMLSGGAVQIGNAVTEKMVLDVLLQARDQGLFSAVTDCGAGGFSSAVGEMGEKIGAEVYLDQAPLKYEGLSYTEIWISEAQERMVLAVPPRHWDQLHALCSSEGVEATIIGKFVDTGRLKLMYQGNVVGDLDMHFLHEGRPPIVRGASYQPPALQPLMVDDAMDLQALLPEILAAPNVASKEWIIRQYDHEVQGGSAIKPLVGACNDGPSDAAVVRPVLDSMRGLVVSCGMNPHYGDLDPYWMAASAIDEAVRNCVAVGADPDRIAILDNFCWGYTDRPETLGSLVRSALACYDVAKVLRTPFISGKDSLNNEFSYDAPEGKQTIAIPATLLISALGQVADVARCVTMDFKSAGHSVYQVGATRDELGGSHLALMRGLSGGQAPKVDAALARRTFLALHQAIHAGCVRACHDLSEGGLAVAAAEMAFAGEVGVELRLGAVVHSLSDDLPPTHRDAVLAFAESNTRFLVEVAQGQETVFEQMLGDLPWAKVGRTTETRRVVLQSAAGKGPIIDHDLHELKRAWQATLNF